MKKFTVVNDFEKKKNKDESNSNGFVLRGGN